MMIIILVELIIDYLLLIKLNINIINKVYHIDFISKNIIILNELK